MKVVFAPGCVLRKKNPDAIPLLMAQLSKIYGNVELYTDCCRKKAVPDAGSMVLSVCSGCVNKFETGHPELTSRKVWDAISEHSEVPFENEAEVRAAVRAAYRAKKKSQEE